MKNSGDRVVPKCGVCGNQKRQTPSGQWQCWCCANRRSKHRYHRLKKTDPGKFAKLRANNSAAKARWAAFPANRERVRKSQRAMRDRMRMACIRHYSKGSMSCACCGEKELEFLTIDHQEGGGRKHRQRIGWGGSSFYRWLVREKFPGGYQVLCMNCNWGRRINGVCPHKQRGTQLLRPGGVR